MSNVFILDNGAYMLKGGYSTCSEPKMMLNAIMKAKSERRRPFIANQIDECRDTSGLFYILPFQKGYLLNWDVQKSVWEHVLGKEVLDVRPRSTTLVLTEPLLNFTSIQEATSEVFFEEYEVEALLRINATDLSVHKYHRDRPRELCCLLVDSGYSFTHVVPYIQGRKEKGALCRIDIGGKILTNHLKDLISYRQLNVMDETHVLNQAKEDACFVSSDFSADMRVTALRGDANTTLRDYVLPDFTSIRRGFLRDRDRSDGRAPNGEQLIRLNNERFSIPELLFTPYDVGIHETGISEAIVNCINKCPEETRPHLYKNILLTGGNCHFPGMRERVYKDVRSMAPDDLTVNVTLAKNPSTYAWQGGAALSRSSQFPEMVVTRRDWDENGYDACERKFNV